MITKRLRLRKIGDRTKIRDGQVGNRPVYVALGVNLAGDRDVLGMWVGTGGEGAKHWMSCLAELRNRGVQDVCILACDGLKGLPESVAEIWPLATVQLCVVHLVRASLRYASKAHWGPITKALREVYTASTVAAAEARFAGFEADWGGKYPVIIKLWRQRLGTVHPVPGLPGRGQTGGLHDQCDRELERPVPPSDPPPRAFPQRTGRAQGALPGRSHPTGKSG